MAIRDWHWGQLLIFWIGSAVVWAVIGYALSTRIDEPSLTVIVLLTILFPGIPLAVSWRWFGGRRTVQRLLRHYQQRLTEMLPRGRWGALWVAAYLGGGDASLALEDWQELLDVPQRCLAGLPVRRVAGHTVVSGDAVGFALHLAVRGETFDQFIRADPAVEPSTVEQFVNFVGEPRLLAELELALRHRLTIQSGLALFQPRESIRPSPTTSPAIESIKQSAARSLVAWLGISAAGASSRPGEPDRRRRSRRRP